MLDYNKNIDCEAEFVRKMDFLRINFPEVYKKCRNKAQKLIYDHRGGGPDSILSQTLIYRVVGMTDEEFIKDMTEGGKQ